MGQMNEKNLKDQRSQIGQMGHRSQNDNRSHMDLMGLISKKVHISDRTDGETR